MPFVSCLSCGDLTRNACRCDHCGAQLKSCSPGKTAAVAALGLFLAACGPPSPVTGAEYGSPGTEDEDRDGDGFDQFDDCDDDDPDRFPGAPETAGDGVDSDCDGEDDPADTGA